MENRDDLKLLKVSLDSKKNINDLISEEFLESLNKEFDNVLGINLVFTVDLKGNDDSDGENIIILGHSSEKRAKDNKLELEVKSIPNNDNPILEKIIKLFE